MRFTLLTEGHLAKGESYETRLRDIVDEAVFAEKMGFDVFGSSEQHFHRSAATVSAPEVLYGALAVATRTIKLRTMSTVTLKYNHGVRIAERLSTIDALSGGRVEFGSARSNDIHYMKVLGVDPSKTRKEWRETIEVAIRAMTQRPCEFHGEYYDFGPLTDIYPRPYLGRCPPIHVSASSVETHRTAGELGFGVMHFDNWFGWDFTRESLAAYDEAVKSAQPIGGLYEPTRNKAVLAFLVHCAETKERAYREVRHVAESIVQVVIGMYMSLYQSGGKDFAYLKDMADNLKNHEKDLEYLQERSSSLLIGDPDMCIARIREYERMGIDEVIMRIDGMGHRTNLRSIEMFGKYVIPAFRRPLGVPLSDEGEDLGVENVPSFLL